MRYLALCLGLLWTTSAFACLNDRDSLAAEVDRQPDIIWIIVGRFERYPPLYYARRIQRIEAELAKDPGKADLYDDIAVAFDRIHQDEKALIWIEKKRRVLEAMGAAATKVHDWYRYYANVGTFHAHHWFATKPAKNDELELAKKDIAKAIELNPDAHSGREGYQLAAISWILSNGRLPEGQKVAFADSPELKETIEKDKKRYSPDGLAGLIRLGGALESPDIYDALADVLSKGFRREMLGQVAILRRDELIKAGKKPVGPLSKAAWNEAGNYAKESKAEFERLRADAESWKRERDDFMIARLGQGKHPDTDTDFWEGFKERPKPDLWRPPFWQTADWYDLGFRIVLLVCVASMTIIITILVRRAVRRRRLRAVA